jgi:hypothetical protein
MPERVSQACGYGDGEKLPLTRKSSFRLQRKNDRVPPDIQLAHPVKKDTGAPRQRLHLATRKFISGAFVHRARIAASSRISGTL